MKRRKSNNPRGRPVTVGGSSAAKVLPVRASAELVERIDAAAAEAKLSRSDWLRLAIEAALGGRVSFGPPAAPVSEAE